MQPPSIPTLLAPLALLFATACASTTVAKPTLTYADPAPDLAPDPPTASVVPASMPVAEPFVIDPEAPNAPELTVWNSPEYKRQFALSFTAYTEVEPSVSLVDVEDLQKVQKLLDTDQVDAAIAFLKENTTSASSARYDYTLANIYFGRDELDAAKEAYEQAIAKFPRFLRAWKNLGFVHFRQGNFDQVQECLSKAITLGEGDGPTYGMLGVAYTNAGNALSAESCFRMATILDPGNEQWELGLARAFFNQERYADAASLTGYMLTTRSERADLWLLQANAYLAMGETLAAAENFELVDSMGASTPESLALLGDIYAQEELFDLAAEGYVRALAMSGADGADKALRNAKVLTSRGATAQAKQLVLALGERLEDELSEAQHKDMLRLRARIALAEGAGAEEAAVLEEILALDPLDGDALILLGQHALREGDAERAIFYFERAEGIAAFESEALVRHAQALVGQGKYNAALPLLRRSLQLDPKANIQEYTAQIERVALGR